MVVLFECNSNVIINYSPFSFFILVILDFIRGIGRQLGLVRIGI